MWGFLFEVIDNGCISCMGNYTLNDMICGYISYDMQNVLAAIYTSSVAVSCIVPWVGKSVVLEIQAFYVGIQHMLTPIAFPIIQ